MMAVVVPLTAALAGLALLHAYWGTGGVWPGTDEESCARTIAGFRGIKRMPSPAASFAVAAALATAALLVLAIAGYDVGLLPKGVALLGGAMAAFVFLARGVAGYLPAWRRLTPEMPFALYDRRYYSPLCLAIGTGFTVLTSQGFVT